MSMQDPISDLLTQIRNGQSSNKVQITVPASKMKKAILQVLVDEGYILGYETISNEGKNYININLKYYNHEPVIATIKRVSSPGLRRYCKTRNIPKVLGGLGLSIISTSRGIMSGKMAMNLAIGGEILCIVE